MIRLAWIGVAAAGIVTATSLAQTERTPRSDLPQPYRTTRQADFGKP